MVLTHLKKFDTPDTLDLKSLTLKTVTLLSICTAHRVQTLSMIKLSNIHAVNDGLEIVITEQIKTSRPGSTLPRLSIPKLVEEPRLCVASHLLAYVNATKMLRQGEDQLFISHQAPHKPVGKQTIAHWIKDTLSQSGINTSTYTAHSVRHASTSAAKKRGLSVNAIRKTAGWSPSSLIFAKHYDRPITADTQFARTVLLNKE